MRTIRRTILAEETEIGEGATLLIEKATPPIIQLLRRNYIQDPNCISGDIDFLFLIDVKKFNADS